MSTLSGGAWKLGLVPQAVANGLSSILVLLFLLSSLNGGLLDVGLVAAVSALALIPSQVLWGRLIDGAGRCKPFLVFGFVGMGLSLAAVPLAGAVPALLGLVSLKSVLYAATLPARQLLTVESESREGWHRGIANMQFLTTLGETAGMGVGALTVAALGYFQLFVLCAALCFASAGLLAVVAREPGFMIQRRLVAVERSTSALVAVSDFVASPARSVEDFGRVARQLGRSSNYLMAGIFGFSLAGSTLFSPLPAYFIRLFSSNVVFLVFFGGSLAGALCYLPVGRLGGSAGRNLVVASSVRMVATPFLALAALGAAPGLIASVTVLAALEAFWAMFDVSSTYAFLESARVGRAGYYGALVGLGAAGGGVLGGVVAMMLGFGLLFVVSAVLCAGSLVAFALQFRA